MKKPWIVFALFVVLALAQLAVPGSIILRHERVMRIGREFKFRTAPVDPYDVFRGRYVALRIAGATTTTLPRTFEAQPDMQVYATLTVDADGFARLGELSREAPAAGDYLKVKVNWVDSQRVNLKLPFERYYMEESQAPRAERAYRELNGSTRPGANPDNGTQAYITVRILHGAAVLQELYLAGKPVREYLARMPEDKP